MANKRKHEFLSEHPVIQPISEHPVIHPSDIQPISEHPVYQMELPPEIWAMIYNLARPKYIDKILMLLFRTVNPTEADQKMIWNYLHYYQEKCKEAKYWYKDPSWTYSLCTECYGKCYVCKRLTKIKNVKIYAILDKFKPVKDKIRYNKENISNNIVRTEGMMELTACEERRCRIQANRQYKAYQTKELCRSGLYRISEDVYKAAICNPIPFGSKQRVQLSGKRNSKRIIVLSIIKE